MREKIKRFAYDKKNMKREKKKFFTEFKILYIKEQIEIKDIVKMVYIITKNRRKTLNYIQKYIIYICLSFNHSMILNLNKLKLLSILVAKFL